MADQTKILNQIINTVNILVDKESGLPIGFDEDLIKDKDLIKNEEYLKALAYLNAYRMKIRQLQRYLEIIKERGQKEDDEARVEDRIKVLEKETIKLNDLKKKYEEEKL